MICWYFFLLSSVATPNYNPEQMESLENKTFVRAKDQVWSALADEIVVLSLGSSVYYGLNPVGAFLWKLLEHPATFALLHQKMLEEYDVDSQTAENHLLELLRRLIEEKLIESVL